MGKGKGRKRKSGERYDCGKLKPTGEPVSGALWHRIKTDAAKAVRDERLASEVGRLSFHRDISDGQAAAGFRVGLIYGVFERDHVGRPRSVRSPSYEIGLSGSAGVCEELMEQEVLRDRVRRERASLEAFTALQDEMKAWAHPRAAKLIEELCVDDCALAHYELPTATWALDRLVSFFGSSNSRKKRKRATGKYIGHAVAGGPKTRKPAEIERSAHEKFIKALRPDLEQCQIDEATEILSALLDREYVAEQRERSKKTLRAESR
jgi:hypothetical protein